MEIKKSPKADLQNKRGLLLEIGLIIALVAVIGAFSYTPKEYRIEQIETETAPVETEITEIIFVSLSFRLGGSKNGY